MSRFHGITIAMYYNDHLPAHFRALFGGEEALILIATLEISAGRLPPRALTLVRLWAERHQGELAEAWEKVRWGIALAPIEPLE